MMVLCSIREAGHTIFWTRKPDGDAQEHFVAIAVKNCLISRLSEDSKPVNERMITPQLPLTQNIYCTLISIYAPIMTNSIENINQLHAQLNVTLGNISESENFVLLGDFNTRVGSDCSSWKSVIRNFGTGKCNSNGEPLLKTCTEHQLVITNTYFKHKDGHKHS